MAETEDIRIDVKPSDEFLEGNQYRAVVIPFDSVSAVVRIEPPCWLSPDVLNNFADGSEGHKFEAVEFIMGQSASLFRFATREISTLGREQEVQDYVETTSFLLDLLGMTENDKSLRGY